MAGLRVRWDAARTTLRNRQLAKLQLSWALWTTGEWASLIALSVVAFQSSGAAAVGLVGVVRLLPAAVLGPLTSMVTDRRSRPRVLAGAHLGWVVVSLSFAWLATSGSAFWVLLLVLGIGSVLSAVYKPGTSALLPQLVRSPAELVAANSVYSLVEAAGIVAGPALAGVLLAVSEPAVTFVVLAVLFAVGALASGSIRTDYQPARAARVSGLRVLAEPLRGFPALLASSGTRVVFSLFLAQLVMRGLVNVFLVVLALSGGGNGEAQTGALFAAMGVGGLIGALLTLGIGGTPRSARWFALGTALWGLPIVVIGCWPALPVALVALTALGLGNALMDVFGFTVLHRLLPDHLAGRAFGAFWSCAAAAVAAGSALAPVLIDLVGLRWAMGLSGAVLVLLPVLLWPALRSVDERTGAACADVALLAAVPVFAPMSAIGLERLAAAARELPLQVGEPAVRQGEVGEMFYVVGDGLLSVTQDGHELRRLSPGDAFGEIALLQVVPRTATVTAVEPCRLLCVDGPSFVAAVTGHRAADDIARQTVERLLRNEP